MPQPDPMFDVISTEPSSQDCTTHRRLRLAIHGRVLEGYACWYPQMGGYSGRAFVVVDDDCLDVYVWHDGQFPFSGDDPPPVCIHHCDPEQFIQFGQLLLRMEDAAPGSIEEPEPERTPFPAITAAIRTPRPDGEQTYTFDPDDDDDSEGHPDA